MLSRREKAALVVVAAALSVGLALRPGSDDNSFGNMGWYHLVEARAVLAGEGFGRVAPAHGFCPDLFLRPTYTLVLTPVVALGASSAAVRVVVALLQGALLGVGGAAAAACLAKVVSPRAARVAAWLVVLDPLMLSQASTIVDTTLFAVSMLGAYALVAGAADAPRRRWAAAGLVLGIALLTRSTAAAVLPAMLRATTRAVRSWGRRLAAAALVGAVAAAVLVPWCARNRALTGRWMLSTVEAVNLWMGNNARTAEFLDEGRSLDELPDRQWRDSSRCELVADQLRRYDLARGEAFEFMRERPGEAARLALRKAGDLWSVVPAPRSMRSRGDELRAIVSVAWTLPLFAFAAVGAVVGLRAGGAARALVGDVLLTCVLFTIPHALAWGGTRLRAPLDPFVAMLAAMGVAALVDRIQSRSSRSTSHVADTSRSNGSSG